jgi:hypothetical protein
LLAHFVGFVEGVPYRLGFLRSGSDEKGVVRSLGAALEVKGDAGDGDFGCGGAPGREKGRGHECNNRSSWEH